MMFELSNLKRDSIVFIHHPDAYLDNKTQLLLADFLVAHALDVENNKTLIIETHSENFLLRIQKRLKQINEKRLPTDLSFLKDNLSQEKIAVIVVVRAQNESSKCFRISLDESGDMREPWPVGFFEEGFVERFVI
jgi:predicted ATPase